MSEVLIGVGTLLLAAVALISLLTVTFKVIYSVTSRYCSFRVADGMAALGTVAVVGTTLIGIGVLL